MLWPDEIKKLLQLANFPLFCLTPLLYAPVDTLQNATLNAIRSVGVSVTIWLISRACGTGKEQTA